MPTANGGMSPYYASEMERMTRELHNAKMRVEELERAIRDNVKYLHPVSQRGEDAKISLLECIKSVKAF